LPDDADVLRFSVTAMVVATLVLFADAAAENRFERMAVSPRAGFARHANASNVAVIALVALCASAILGLFWERQSTDTDQHATSVVMSRYGAELKRMGFLDAGLYTSADVTAVQTVTYDFADGSQDFPPPIIEWGVAASGSPQHDSLPHLVMRMREGKLTILAPPRAPGMTPAQADDAEIKAADVTMDAIRNAYGQVQRNRAANETPQD
jgi:hypothetical protein